MFIYWSAYYGWLTGEEQQLQQYYVNIIENCFIAVGSVLAGILMVKGRKLTIQIGLLVVAVGFIPSFFLNWPLYLCSRAIVATGIGLSKTTASRYAEEYLPLAYYGMGNAAIQFFAALGLFELSLMAFLYPSISDPMTAEEV